MCTHTHIHTCTYIFIQHSSKEDSRIDNALEYLEKKVDRLVCLDGQPKLVATGINYHWNLLKIGLFCTNDANIELILSSKFPCP